MLTQNPTAKRIAPLVVEESEEEAPEGYLPAYEFEPEPDELLDALLPKYVNARIYAALLESAASESASRRRAMKSATDNAEELIKTYTREANQARQAEITQEISEIVGGADALAAAGSEMTHDRGQSETTGIGRVVRVIGPVVDVEFGRDAMPELQQRAARRRRAAPRQRRTTS